MDKDKSLANRLRMHADMDEEHDPAIKSRIRTLREAADRLDEYAAAFDTLRSENEMLRAVIARQGEPS